MLSTVKGMVFVSKYLNEYPWLRTVNMYTGKLDSNHDAMDDMIEQAPGWEIAFGEMFCKDLDEAIKKSSLTKEFHIVQLKEKYGTLRVYANQRSKFIDDVLNKYSVISAHVCSNCGKPDVPMTYEAWFLPLCKNCYLNSNKRKTEADYERYCNSQDRIPDFYETGNCFNWSDGTSSKETERIYIKDTANMIRNNWKNNKG